MDMKPMNEYKQEARDEAEARLYALLVKALTELSMFSEDVGRYADKIQCIEQQRLNNVVLERIDMIRLFHEANVRAKDDVIQIDSQDI